MFVGTDSRVVCQLLQGGAIGAGPRGQCLVFQGGPLLLYLFQTANLFNLLIYGIFYATTTTSFAIDSKDDADENRVGLRQYGHAKTGPAPGLCWPPG